VVAPVLHDAGVEPAEQDTTTAEATQTQDTAAAAEPTPKASPEPKPRSYKGVGAKVLRLRRDAWEDVWLVTLTHRGQSTSSLTSSIRTAACRTAS
jgi:hypothetical protein